MSAWVVSGQGCLPQWCTLAGTLATVVYAGRYSSHSGGAVTTVGTQWRSQWWYSSHSGGLSGGTVATVVYSGGDTPGPVPRWGHQYSTDPPHHHVPGYHPTSHHGCRPARSPVHCTVDTNARWEMSVFEKLTPLRCCEKRLSGVSRASLIMPA